MTSQAETVEEEFRQFYGHEAWTGWRRFLVHFDLGEGFAFLVLLLPGAVGAKICQRHLSEYLAAKGKRLAEVACEWREDARRLGEHLFDLEVTDDLGGVWTGSVVPDSDPEIEEWRKAWRWGLASLNERRNPLQCRFSCPLVLVGAPWLQALLREAAPDLWSIRTAVVSVIPSLGPAEPREGSNVQIEPGRFLKGEAASDPDYTLEQAGRLRGRPGMDSTLARLLLRSGNGFYEHARYEAAEKCFREAAEILARLAPGSAELKRDWAGVLNNLGSALSALGQREEAVAKAQQAARIWQQLAQARPDAFLLDLAMSLNNLSNGLGDLGRREEALAKAQEAVRIYEQLAQARPEAFLPDLAMSLNNLGNRLSDLGRREEALAKAREAVRIREQLAQARPDAFLPGLAMSLNNLSNGLSDLGRREEALAKAQEAARIYEQLAQVRPDAFLPDLAMSLNNLVNRLSDLGRGEEALAKAQEAVRMRERLAQARPDAFVPGLARSCGTLGSVLRSQGQHAEAAAAFARGIRVLGPLFQKLPQAFSDLMVYLCRGYSEAIRQAKMEPDMALLGPVERVLEELRPARPGE